MTTLFRRMTSYAMTACLIMLAACTTNETSLEAGDPLEPLNRKILAFNIAADNAVIGPVARGYMAVTPDPAERGVSNFFANLRQPVVFANTLLQGRPVAAIETGERFVVNTILGIGGLGDPASRFDIPEYDEDFGQTLAVWGVPDGPYLVWPFRGPSNLRDSVGWAADRQIHPYNWNDEYRESDWMTGVRILEIIKIRTELERQFNSLDEAADPYVMTRSAWQQNRRLAINNGEEDYDELPDFDD